MYCEALSQMNGSKTEHFSSLTFAVSKMEFLTHTRRCAHFLGRETEFCMLLFKEVS